MSVKKDLLPEYCLTCERASTVRVDLMDSHAELTTLRDLRELIAGDVHDGLSASFRVVVPLTEGLAEALCRITTEAGAVLLEGVAASAVTGGVGIDAKTHATTASVAGGFNDCAVAIDSPAGGQDGEKNGGSLRNHFE